MVVKAWLASALKDPSKPLLLQEPHICRGLNPTCKGEVAWKKNYCAGQAHAATVKEHACKGHNDCVGGGGCGEKPGENKCKGMGDCAVPLKDDAWKKARKNFEAAMTKGWHLDFLTKKYEQLKRGHWNPDPKK